MKNRIVSTISICLIIIIVLNVYGCDPYFVFGGGTPDHLVRYNTTSAQIVTLLENIVQSTHDIYAALDAEEEDAVTFTDVALAGSIDHRAKQIDDLVTALDALAVFEEGIQFDIEKLTASKSVNGRNIQSKFAFLGTALFVAGAMAFASKMKSLSNQMSEHRKRRDDAMVDTMQNKKGALTKYHIEKKGMKDTGLEAIEETTKVVTNELLSPVTSFIPPEADLLLKSAETGVKMAEDYFVLSASKECKNGYQTSGCTIGAAKTDENGEAKVPVGDLTLSVSGNDSAREKYEDVTTKVGETKSVYKWDIPTSGATTAVMAELDEGTYTGGGNGLGDGGTASGTWMTESWNALQLQYQVSGAAFSDPVDREVGGSGSGFTEIREYADGTLDGGNLVVTGTATSSRENHPSTYPSRLSVSVSTADADDEFTDETDPDEGPWSVSFSVTIPTPAYVTTASFSIALTYVNPTYGNRTLLVTGSAIRE